MPISFEQSMRYVRWLDKKMKDKPAPVKTMMRRTLGTAMAVLDELNGIPFSSMSASLYFLCQDLDTKEFTRLYESQLELALANQDMFVKNLYKFLNDMSRFIKKNNLYQEFFEFICLCEKVRYSRGFDIVRVRVLNAYQSLLLQTMEFMRPNKYDFNVVICGLTTDGELMTLKDFAPNIDSFVHRVEEFVLNAQKTAKTKEETEQFIQKTFSEAGFPEVASIEDMELLMNVDRLFTNHHATLSCFIDEYSYDILPKNENPYDGKITTFTVLHTKLTDQMLEELTTRLMTRRARMLPANGMRFKFPCPTAPDGVAVKTLLLREVYHDDHIVMLYKLMTMSGELCGYLDTSDGYFFSVLHADLDTDNQPYELLKKFISYCYGCAVDREGAKMLEHFPEMFQIGVDERFPFLPVSAEMWVRGGKPRRTDGKEPEHRGTTGPRAGNDAYYGKETPIQGFIRKVGEGRTPSREAVERAEALGFSLAPDETYVQPFIKRVLRLKEKRD